MNPIKINYNISRNINLFTKDYFYNRNIYLKYIHPKIEYYDSEDDAFFEQQETNKNHNMMPGDMEFVISESILQKILNNESNMMISHNKKTKNRID